MVYFHLKLLFEMDCMNSLSYGDEYIKWVYLKDITGPEITPLEIENGLYGESNFYYNLWLKINYIISININLNFDGEQVDVAPSYKDESKTLTYANQFSIIRGKKNPIF